MTTGHAPPTPLWRKVLSLPHTRLGKWAIGLAGRGRGAPCFRYPSPQEVWAAGLYTREVRNNHGLLGDGLDVRGEGGYVVAPPSNTQRAYRWIDRSPPPVPLGCSVA